MQLAISKPRLTKIMVFIIVDVNSSTRSLSKQMIIPQTSDLQLYSRKKRIQKPKMIPLRLLKTKIIPLRLKSVKAAPFLLTDPKMSTADFLLSNMIQMFIMPMLRRWS